MLTARSISYAVDGSRQILTDLSIAIRPGQITVLVGPSGAGKTTLLRCLAQLVHPTAGELSVDNRSYVFPGRNNPRPPWPEVTAVFQQHFLWPHLTLRQNILLPLVLNQRLQKERVEELIEILGLKEFVDRFPSQASLGERQRVAIARALALNPAYVLLDEITSALDVEQSCAILKHLFELKRRKIGMLLITHQLEFAKAILERDPADQLAFLDEGRIVETGGAGCLLEPKHPRVANFVEKMGFRIG
jgi:cystine transport system ATP-binding protein